MKYANSKYIAFVDDDDLLANDYVDIFYKEVEIYPLIDVLIFRMYHRNNVFPRPTDNTFYKDKVGISFVINKKIVNNGLIFKPSRTEDYDYLNLIRENKYKMMISPYIKYYVRGLKPNNLNKEYNRVFIN